MATVLSQIDDFGEQGSIPSLVMDQSWQYDKIDDAILQQWIQEIDECERRRESDKTRKESVKFWKFGREDTKIDRDCAISKGGSMSEKSDPSSIVSGGTVVFPKLQSADSMLSDDCWNHVFKFLNESDLPQCSLVCKLWHRLISFRSKWSDSFVKTWKLRSVAGFPSTSSFRRPSLSQFAMSHKLILNDSIASLAIQFNVPAGDIRRLNMLMSDHGIHMRDRLLIPVIREDFLIDKECFIEKDFYSRREVAVLYPEGKPGQPSELDQAMIRARERSAARMKRKVMESFMRSLGVDEGTASFYLNLANGDVRKAYAEYTEDLKWAKTRNVNHR